MRRIPILTMATLAVVIISSGASLAAPPAPSIGEISPSITGGPVDEGGKTWCVYSADVTITFKGKYDLRVQSPSGAPSEKRVTGSGTETVTVPDLWVEAGTSGRFTATLSQRHVGTVATGLSDPVAVPSDCASS